MIHIIYSYFIIVGMVLGYYIGDQFNMTHLLLKLVQAVLWLPHLLYEILKIPLTRLWDLDFIQIGLVHMGFNRITNIDEAQNIIAQLEKQMVPIWTKWKTGRYYISGLEKLKKMNTKNT